MSNSTPIWTLGESQTLLDWRARYAALGLKTIPLKGKQPLDPISWKTTSLDQQWEQAGQGFDGNIGIIAGNGRVIVDADNIDTAYAIAETFNGMGISPVSVWSPHGMHFYLNCSDVPDDFNYGILAKDKFEGELRARNCYVVSPCSQINGIPYRWANCEPESLLGQQVIQWKDLAWLLPLQIDTHQKVAGLPFRLLERGMPAKAKGLLQALSGASKGQPIIKYPSRSEAEAAVISMLILAGWQYEKILDTFHEWAPGKFSEVKGKSQQDYFDRTYSKALTFIVEDATRQQIASVWHEAKAKYYWPGRQGFPKKSVYLGLLAVCWQFKSWQVNASERDLALYTASGRQSVHTSLLSLRADGLVKFIGRDSFKAANRWLVFPLNNATSEIMTSGRYLREDFPDSVELWSRQELGKTSGELINILDECPKSVTSLSKTTGKAWGTVKSALEKMKAVGLAQLIDGGWVRGETSIEEVAYKQETKSLSSRRRNTFDKERERFKRFHSGQ